MLHILLEVNFHIFHINRRLCLSPLATLSSPAVISVTKLVLFFLTSLFISFSLSIAIKSCCYFLYIWEIQSFFSVPTSKTCVPTTFCFFAAAETLHLIALSLNPAHSHSSQQRDLIQTPLCLLCLLLQLRPCCMSCFCLFSWRPLLSSLPKAILQGFSDYCVLPPCGQLAISRIAFGGPSPFVKEIK